MDEDIRTIVRNEVKRQLSSATDVSVAANTAETKEHVAKNLNVIIADMDENLSILKAFCASLTETAEKMVVIQQPKTPPVIKETHLRGKGIVFKKEPEPEPEPEQEEGEDLGEDNSDEGWVKKQDGDLEKGETQIWKYGNHELTVWNDGRKYFAQVDGEKEEELWRQKDLEKIQRRVEKLP